MRCADPDLTDLLLAAGADINAKNKLAWTPLHEACAQTGSYRTIDVVKVLLRHHADIYARTLDGKTPLDTAEGADDAVLALRRAGGKTGAELDAEKRVRHAW